MEPRLYVISGPRKGETFFILSTVEAMIGRDSEWLLLNDLSASRHHSKITIEGQQCKIEDLGSRNGTFVNKVPIKERILQHGDFIEIGSSLFVFLSRMAEDDEPTPIKTEIIDSKSFLHSTILPPRRIARDFQALLKISNTIASSRTLESLQNELLQTIFEFIPVQRGAILLSSQDSSEFHTAFSCHKNKEKSDAIQVSRDVALRVLGEGTAMMSAAINERIGPIRASPGTSSILCAPLIALQRVIGVLYLETDDSSTRLDEDHLQLLAAIAAVAGVAIENCRHMENLQIENEQLKADLKIEHDMIGESAAMRNVYNFVARVAPTDSTVLIYGETGTGKELAARAIHQNSYRASKPFVAINCATLSETLLESELFGHQKGAFTGAVTQKKGKLELADGGTVFLDEVAEIAPALQAKLLRVLQERQFERLGGTSSICVDIRLISATNKNLEHAVAEGSFRQDLYYRLNVLHLSMPPLRERVEDISLLAAHFAAKYGRKMNKKTVGFSPEARRFLICYRWPGNVRELENAIEHALVLGTLDSILPEDLPEIIIESQPANVQLTRYQEAIKEAKRQLILRAMDDANGNYVEAAKLLEIHPNNLHRLIRDLDLKSSIGKSEIQ